MESDRVMHDHKIIDMLSANSETLHISRNAHREMHTTVARHLLHRERLGDVIIFTSPASQLFCLETETLWEVSFRNSDDRLTHIAGANLDECLKLASATMAASRSRPIAA